MLLNCPLYDGYGQLSKSDEDSAVQEKPVVMPGLEFLTGWKGSRPLPVGERAAFLMINYCSKLTQWKEKSRLFGLGVRNTAQS